MKPYYEENGITIYHGDCREVLPSLVDCSVDSVVTDPPYELGFMGKAWDRSGIAYQVEVWRECLRALKPGGYLLAFGGSRTYHRLACSIEDAGFEIRDQIQWIYGSGFPKSLDVSKAIDAVVGSPFPIVGLAEEWKGWGTALKPAHEPIALARKPLIGTVVENVLRHGTGGLNIDDCRIEGDVPTCTGTGFNTDKYTGQVGRGEPTMRGVEFNGNALGRWPANVIHDGSQEVLARFPETTSGSKDLIQNGWGSNGIYGHGQPHRKTCEGDSGSAARFFYCAKASQEDRDDGLEESVMRQRDESRKAGNVGGNNPRNRGLQPRANHHPTVKPTDLMRYLCRLVTPPNGTVLDPFCGSGSTGRGAALEGFNFIGIELDAEYCTTAEKRIEAVTRQGMLTFT